MNWDDLLTPLLFLLFIGVPLLNRLNHRQRSQQKPNQPRNINTPTPPPTSQSGRDIVHQHIQETPAVDPELEYRLELARRKVAEAKAKATRPNHQLTSSMATSDNTLMIPASTLTPNNDDASPMLKSLVTEDKAKTHPESVDLRKPSNLPSMLQGLPDATPFVKSKPLDRFPLITGSKEEIIQGILWKQILDEPLFKRPWRPPFQRR